MFCESMTFIDSFKSLLTKMRTLAGTHVWVFLNLVISSQSRDSALTFIVIP